MGRSGARYEQNAAGHNPAEPQGIMAYPYHGYCRFLSIISTGVISIAMERHKAKTGNKLNEPIAKIKMSEATH